MCGAGRLGPTPTSPRRDIPDRQVAPLLRAQEIKFCKWDSRSDTDLYKGGSPTELAASGGCEEGLLVLLLIMAESTARFVTPELIGATNPIYRRYRVKSNLSPAVARAMDLWLSGAVKTKKEAAAAVGIHAVTLSLNSRSPAGIGYMTGTHELIQDKTIDTSVLIEKLSRRGIEVIATLMEDAEKEDIRFRAAQDLADRGKETAKTQKLSMESYTIANRDVAALANAMVAAATLKDQFPEAASGNFITAGSEESPSGE